MMGENGVPSHSLSSDAPLQPGDGIAPWKPILRNAFWLFSGNITAQGLAAVMGLLLARGIGPQGYGLYATAFALAAAFTHAALMGLDSVVPRYVARRPESAGSVLLGALCPALLWLPILMLLIGGLAVALGYPREILLLVFPAALTTGVRGLLNLFRSVMRGLERMNLDAAFQTAENGVTLLGVMLILSIAPSALNTTLTILLTEGLALFFAGLWTWRMVSRVASGHPKMLTRPQTDLAKEMLLAAVPLGLTFTLIGLSLRLDTLVLSLFRPIPEVGFYSAAFVLVMISRSVALMSAAFLPRLSALAGRDDLTFARLRDGGLYGMLIIGTGIGVTMAVLAPFIIGTLYGAPFLTAVPALRVLGIASIALFVNTYCWQVLIAQNRQGTIARMAILSLLLSLPLALLLIPRWGAVGAALVTLAREVMQCLPLTHAILRPPRSLPRRAFLSPIPAAAAMAFVLCPVRAETGPVVLPYLLLSSVAYLGVLLLGDGGLRNGLRGWVALR